MCEEQKALVKLKELVDEFNEKGDMVFYEGASKEKIELFEELNEIELPKGYKSWLLFSDGGELFIPAGVQLYGIAEKPIINVNDSDRPDEKYLVIGALSNGDPILCEKGNECISIYNHEKGIIEDDETYIDFYTFLNDLCDLLGIGE